MLVGPGEGAGVIDVGDGLAVAIRIESHNHPSAVEPYQGAATGVGGIIRDIFSMGARPIALMDPLRFGPLDDARTRYLVEGVVAGISGYGNAVGVPTVGGEVVFDDCYRENPLVNVLCLGVLPVERLVLAKAEGVGNLAVLLGSATGRDGIGGASVLASAGFSEGDEAKRPSVQVGDPYEEKRLIEACLELLDAGLAIGVQDLGAAGISCAASETAAKTGAGMDVDLARMPKREPGMNGVEVMTSESQERMLAIVTPGEPRARCSSCAGGGRSARRSSDASPTPRASACTTACSTRSACPAATRRRRAATTPPVLSSDRAARRRRARRQPRRRPGLRPPARPARRPRRDVHADDPAPALGTRSSPTAATSAPSCSRCSRRRPSPTSRGCTASTTTSCSSTPWSRPAATRGAAAEGHAARARAHHRRQGAVLRARPARRRAPRGDRGGPQPRVRGRDAARRWSTASTSATPSIPR